MIKASHSKFFEFAYRIYVERILRSSFGKFILVNDPPAFDNSRGLIVTPNHFSWWDGFFADYVMRRVTRRTPYIMMLEDQLRKYSFFRKIGAFSIRPGSAESVRESLDYAKLIVSDNSNYLIFYPQGEIQNYPGKNVLLKKGLREIVDDEDMVAVVSFKILYANEKLPYVCCRFGEMISGYEVRNKFEEYQRTFLKNIEKLEEYEFSKSDRDLFIK